MKKLDLLITEVVNLNTPYINKEELLNRLKEIKNEYNTTTLLKERANKPTAIGSKRPTKTNKTV